MTDVSRRKALGRRSWVVTEWRGADGVVHRNEPASLMAEDDHYPPSGCKDEEGNLHYFIGGGHWIKEGLHWRRLA